MDEQYYIPRAPPSKAPAEPTTYGSTPSTHPSPHDSAIAVSPAAQPFTAPLLPYTYSHPHGRRIIPPSISGHGRLIIAFRTVPYWAGVLIVLGSFAWAVLVAVGVCVLLGKKHGGLGPGVGRGDCEGWFC